MNTLAAFLDAQEEFRSIAQHFVDTDKCGDTQQKKLSNGDYKRA